jgi:hypothetical protein
MQMNKHRKLILIASIMVLLFSGGVALAEGRYRQIEVYFDRINIAINGQASSLTKDSLIYDGTVYVPIRNLSELLGADVGWNNTDRTVTLDFIADKAILVNQSYQKGIYQYIAIEHNRMISTMITAFESNDNSSLRSVVVRYEELSKITDGLGNSTASELLKKLAAGTEMLRSGLENKNTDDYMLAWIIYRDSAASFNAILTSMLS